MRAQFEAMGLAVIVILVSLGMFLFILFSFNNNNDAPSRYESQQLAQNTVSALVKTSVPSCSLNYDDLIEDVALRNKNPCDEPSLALLGNMTNVVLNATLDNRSIAYRYQVREIGGSKTVYYAVGTCPLSANADVGRMVFRLPPTTKTVEAILWVC